MKYTSYTKKNNNIFLKKVLITIIITLCLGSIQGCSKKDNTPVDQGKNEISNEENSPSNTSSQTKVNEEENTQDKSQKVILDNIKKLAGEGKIINCDFPVKTTTLQDIEKKWGKADKMDWVPKAKGNYSTYSKNNVVFGTNKGDQVFEVRSFDSQLKQITLSKVMDYFGSPDHQASSDEEKILGYVCNNEFKILFVFNETDSNGNPQLDHYSILYPKGTINNMAGDPGREW